jgi:hypothetical protein|tara:strand:+ start:556 stop:810 length:255 start_codon:yes stop_codon:yes gene_type:complete
MRTLRGFCDLKLETEEISLVLKDCSVHHKTEEGSERQWIGLPATSFRIKTGKKWTNVVQIPDRDQEHAFEALAFEAIDNWCNGS